MTRTENNFGGWQHRQKVFPTFVRAALAGESLPVYGDGGHVRCWLHVEQHCAAIWHLIQYSIASGHTSQPHPSYSSEPGYWPTLGEVFHIAGEQEMTNLELAETILKALDLPPHRIRFVPDHNIRPGHDRRYALNCDKLRATGFEIKQDLPKLIKETVRWYADNPEWCR